MIISIEKQLTSEIERLTWKLLPASLNSLSNQGALLLLEDKLFIQGREISVASTADWDAITQLGRSEQRIAQMNSFIGDAVQAFLNTADQQFLNAAARMCRSWAAAHNWDSHASGMAYHDETTARRVAYWTRLIVVIQATNAAIKIDDIKKRLSIEVDILSQDSFYAGNNNHGMFQNLALLYYNALIQSESAHALKPMQRLVDYFEWSIAADGVHKEHSPSYNYLIARNISAHLKLFSYFDTDIAARLKELLRRMARYAVNIVTPDGHYPPLGDTPPQKIPGSYLRTFADVSPLPPIEKFSIFEDGGYAIIRDDPKLGHRQTFIVFCASHHGIYHKHSDDLGIVLYSDGWIISEGGPYGYDYSHPLSKHAYSSAAHSTLHLPEIAPSKEAGKVRILEWSHDTQVSRTKAINLRYEGVTHEREIIFSRPSRALTVKDTVEGPPELEKYILWQLAPDVQLQRDGQNILLCRNTQIIARMTIAGDVKESDLLLGRGNTNPEIAGYRFSNFGQVDNTTVLAIKLPRQSQVEIITSVILPASKSTALKPTVKAFIKKDHKSPYIQATATCEEDTAVAYYLIHNNKIIEKKPYGKTLTAKFSIPNGAGPIIVRAFFKQGDLVIDKVNSNPIYA